MVGEHSQEVESETGAVVRLACAGHAHEVLDRPQVCGPKGHHAVKRLGFLGLIDRLLEDIGEALEVQSAPWANCQQRISVLTDLPTAIVAV